MNNFELQKIKYISKENCIYIIMIFLMSSVSFFWFDEPTIISGYGDFSFIYSPSNEFYRSIFTWSEHNLGSISSRNVARIFIYYLPVNILSFIMSLSNIEKLIFFFFLFASGFGMYCLIYYLLRDKNFSRISAFLGANLYMFNMYVLQFHWHHLISLFSYSMAPLIFLCFLKLLDTRKYKYLLISGVISLIASPSGDNPLYFGIIILMIIAYFIYDLIISIIKREEVIHKIIFFIFIIVIIIIINSFWILPNIATISTQLLEVQEQPHSRIEHIKKFESPASFIDSYRFLGHWAFKGGYKGWKYYPYHEIYYTSIFIFIGFLILIFVILSLFNLTRKILFFAIMAIISLLLIQGPNPPLGWIYTYLWKNIPIFTVYDRPIDKFGTFYVFSLSVMLGAGTQYIFSIISRKEKITNITFFIFLLIFGSINVYAFPFWTGEIFPYYPDESPLSGGRMVLPDYYTSISKKLELDGDFKILGLPGGGGGATGYWVPYKWRYVGKDPLYSYYFTYYKPIIKPDINYSYDIVTTNIYSIERRWEFEKLLNILKYTNIKYIFLRKDVDTNFYSWIVNPEKEEKFLNNISDIKYVGRYGEILIYSINNQPHFYTTSKVTLINMSINLYEIFVLNVFRDISLFFTTSDLNLEKSIFSRDIGYMILNIYKNSYDIPELSNFNWKYSQSDSIFAVYYPNVKSVIRTDGAEQENTISFPSLEACPYEFPPYSPTGWNAFNSTLIYIKTGDEHIRIASILENGEPVKGIIGIWWESGWMGMGTKPVEFPVIIPPNQKAIIQINHKVANLSIATLEIENISRYFKRENKPLPLIKFKKVNPTKYYVRVENATQPFFLVFSESYHSQWKVYAIDKYIKMGETIAEYPNVNVKEARHDWYKFTPQDILYLFKNPAINETYHFKANGYANAWYVNPREIDMDGDGKFTFVIYFLPQSYFYLGLFISFTSLMFCIGYLFYDWRREKGDRWARRVERRIKSVAGKVYKRR